MRINLGDGKRNIGEAKACADLLDGQLDSANHKGTIARTDIGQEACHTIHAVLSIHGFVFMIVKSNTIIVQTRIVFVNERKHFSDIGAFIFRVLLDELHSAANILVVIVDFLFVIKRVINVNRCIFSVLVFIFINQKVNRYSKC